MAGGIPSSLKKFNERLDQVERDQQTLQCVVDDEVLPAVKTATAKADAAIETASKALAATARIVSKKSDSRRRKPRK